MYAIHAFLSEQQFSNAMLKLDGFKKKSWTIKEDQNPEDHFKTIVLIPNSKHLIIR